MNLSLLPVQQYTVAEALSGERLSCGLEGILLNAKINNSEEIPVTCGQTLLGNDNQIYTAICDKDKPKYLLIEKVTQNVVGMSNPGRRKALPVSNQLSLMQGIYQAETDRPRIDLDLFERNIGFSTHAEEIPEDEDFAPEEYDIRDPETRHMLETKTPKENTEIEGANESPQKPDDENEDLSYYEKFKSLTLLQKSLLVGSGVIIAGAVMSVIGTGLNRVLKSDDSMTLLIDEGVSCNGDVKIKYDGYTVHTIKKEDCKAQLPCKINFGNFIREGKEVSLTENGQTSSHIYKKNIPKIYFNGTNQDQLTTSHLHFEKECTPKIEMVCERYFTEIENECTTLKDLKVLTGSNDTWVGLWEKKNNENQCNSNKVDRQNLMFENTIVVEGKIENSNAEQTFKTDFRPDTKKGNLHIKITCEDKKIISQTVIQTNKCIVNQEYRNKCVATDLFPTVFLEDV